MRILFVTGTRVPSRAANCVHILKLCQEFRREGHAVRLIAQPPLPRPASFDIQRDLWDAFSIHSSFELQWLQDVRFTKGYGYPVRVRLHAARFRPDLILTRNLRVALIAAWTGLPTILDLHTPRRERGLFRLLLRAPGLRRLVAITRVLRDDVRREAGARLPEAKIIVAPDGVDLDQFEGLPDPVAARGRLGLPAEMLTVGYSGNMYRGRGIEMILELAAALPELQFLLVGGSPPEVDAFRRIACERGLQNTTFTGYVSNRELPAHLAACDILLMPYQREIAVAGGDRDTTRWCSPLKMFEYMAAGRCIISSDLPVLREVLHDENALFCDPEDVVQWREAIAKAAGDADGRRALARRALADVQGLSWRNRARAILGDG